MKPTGLFALDEPSFGRVYSLDQRAAIGQVVELVGPRQSGEDLREDAASLANAELLFSGWGGPLLDSALLDHAPKLTCVFFAAGSVRQIMTQAAWQRGIRITSAFAANAIPVAEFTVSQIVFCLKLGWQHLELMKQRQRWEHLPEVPGAFGSTVGLVSLGQVGQRVCRMLRQYDVRVLAFDPFVSSDLATDLKVELVDLETVFVESDVVSLHTPDLPETQRIITGQHITAMKPQASLINTARGAIVNEPELIGVLQERQDLVAVLDVTVGEPPEPSSLLWTLPNAILLPHIAGSMDRECHRMGQCMVDELRRYLAGQPLLGEITQEMASRLA